MCRTTRWAPPWKKSAHSRLRLCSTSGQMRQTLQHKNYIVCHFRIPSSLEYSHTRGIFFLPSGAQYILGPRRDTEVHTNIPPGVHGHTTRRPGCPFRHMCRLAGRDSQARPMHWTERCIPCRRKQRGVSRHTLQEKTHCWAHIPPRCKNFAT